MQLRAVSHQKEKDLNSIGNLKINKLTLSFFRSQVGEVKVQPFAIKEQQTHSTTHREVFRYYSRCQTCRRRSHLLPLPRGWLALQKFASSPWDGMRPQAGGIPRRRE